MGIAIAGAIGIAGPYSYVRGDVLRRWTGNCGGAIGIAIGIAISGRNARPRPRPIGGPRLPMPFAGPIMDNARFELQSSCSRHRNRCRSLPSLRVSRLPLQRSPGHRSQFVCRLPGHHRRGLYQQFGRCDRRPLPMLLGGPISYDARFDLPWNSPVHPHCCRRIPSLRASVTTIGRPGGGHVGSDLPG